MKTILILGAGPEQAYAISCARSKGLHVIAIDRNPAAVGAPLASEFEAISTRDLQAVLSFVDRYGKKIDGVMTIASDIPHIVSAIAERLRVPHVPLGTAEVCVDKLRMKEVLAEKGVSVPAFTGVETVAQIRAFIQSVGYPVVIKPVDNSGARGVLVLTEGSDIDALFSRSKENSFSGRVIAEKFIDGPQISTEGIMLNDRFFCTGFADRNYARMALTAPNLVEDGGDIPTRLEDRQKRLVEEEFERAVRALGIDWGPAKGDMVLGTDGKPYVIEIAARLSGGNFCYDKVPWSTGVDIVDILIDMAVGADIDVHRFEPTRSLATSQRYFFPPAGELREIRGVERARAMPSVKKIDIWVKPGERIEPVENHPSRVGYVITLAPTRDEAISHAEAAISSVDFIVRT